MSLNAVVRPEVLRQPDFWALVELFGNLDKTKKYAAEVKEGLRLIEEMRSEQRAEATRLTDLAAEIEVLRKELGDRADALDRLKADIDAKNVKESARLKDLEDKINADRLSVTARETAVSKRETAVKIAEEAAAATGAQVQKLNDQRAAELTARESVIADKEADLAARYDKLRAALDR